ncbi:MAG TPA: isoprenylcysteine carboxylmethyltransferase family protein [Verrucomicrobiae bacterium]|jgi:protein-S-isoprenylcysteine O-methyltransferase Ste14|nr:isoprenylcysteine carboxylmethyltransferase family protein [Verrucomicrobiae bacterium]
MPSWARIATRSRVPLGFLFAGAFIWFAHPGWKSVAAGWVIVVAGLLVRATASGHIRKNAELTTTGPYAYVRNPLYLGSILIAIGFMVAARNWWIALGAAAMFLFIYVPVVRAEEKYLRATFVEYGEYSARVSSFWPRATAYRSGDNHVAMFSRELYLRHREYNALIGSVLVLSVLILKIFWA